MPTHVLLVEDDVWVAEVLADGLETDGHTVEVAANGLLALAKIETHTYDVIISDLRMPELDGRGLYREIDRWQPALLSRLIFITGAAERPEYQRFLQEIGVPILPKPFDVADLLQAVRLVLSGQR
jgi:CheY-like chemotaxis protein